MPQIWLGWYFVLLQGMFIAWSASCLWGKNYLGERERDYSSASMAGTIGAALGAFGLFVLANLPQANEGVVCGVVSVLLIICACFAGLPIVRNTYNYFQRFMLLYNLRVRRTPKIALKVAAKPRKQKHSVRWTTQINSGL